jgi:hypothetical protein
MKNYLLKNTSFLKILILSTLFFTTIYETVKSQIDPSSNSYVCGNQIVTYDISNYRCEWINCSSSPSPDVDGAQVLSYSHGSSIRVQWV